MEQIENYKNNIDNPMCFLSFSYVFLFVVVISFFFVDQVFWHPLDQGSWHSLDQGFWQPPRRMSFALEKQTKQ